MEPELAVYTDYKYILGPIAVQTVAATVPVVNNTPGVRGRFYLIWLGRKGGKQLDSIISE